MLDDELITAWTATTTQAGLASAKRVDRLVQAVAEARVNADTVVVYLHWGVARNDCPVERQQTLAQALTDAGADIVVGGHAHRLQGAGMLGSTFVGYGLGNFAFTAISPGSERTGVVRVTVTGRHVDGYEFLPGVSRARCRPRSPVTRRRRRSTHGMRSAPAPDSRRNFVLDAIRVVFRCLLRRERRYFRSHSLWACFCAACFICFVARFSLRDLPGFLAWWDGFDFSAISPA